MAWTPEQAAEMRVKALAVRRANGFARRADASRIAEHIADPSNAAHTRRARLWLTIEALDAKIAALSVKDGPQNGQLAKLIAATGALQRQALELGDPPAHRSNGQVKPEVVAQVNLPPPTPAGGERPN